MSDGFEKYIAFERFRRIEGKSIQEFIPEWTTAYKKAKNIGCVLPDKVLAFKLLDAANLSQLERNLVLTGVDYTDAKILDQMQTALKKFIGRTALGQNEDQRNVDSTYLTADNFETVLLSKGWTKPRSGGRGGLRGRGGKREREEPSEQSQEKRRKNYLGRDGKISKCFKCTCKHETDCDCECTHHLLDERFIAHVKLRKNSCGTADSTSSNVRNDGRPSYGSCVLLLDGLHHNSRTDNYLKSIYDIFDLKPINFMTMSQY